MSKQHVWERLAAHPVLESLCKAWAATRLNTLYARLDVFMISIMMCQWAAAVLVAYLYTPVSWGGVVAEPQSPMAAVFAIGAMAALLPAAIAYWQRGTWISRCALAAGQVALSGMWIPLMGAPTAGLWYLFASLALLAAYLDWRVLATGWGVAMADQALRGTFADNAVLTTSVTLSLILLVRFLQQRLNDRLDRQSKLEQGLAHSTALLDNLFDGVLVTDPQGVILYANPTAASALELPLEDLIHRDCRELLGEQVCERLHTCEKVCFRETLRMQRGNHHFQVLVSPINTSVDEQDSHHIGCTVTLRDVTRDLEVEEMKNRFISAVSHELRTPLTAMIGFAQLNQNTLNKSIRPLLPQDDPELNKRLAAMDHNLGIVVSEGNRLTDLLNDLLDIARMESRLIDWKQERVDISELLQEAIDQLRPALKEHELQLEVICPLELAELLVDRERIKQVLLNLLSNAIKFTLTGGILVEVNERDGQMVVTIADSGCGIAQKDLDRVFDRFQQVTSEDGKSKPKGTGLGLPISKGIIEQHGGRIWCSSVLGKGSTVTFTLPVRAGSSRLATRDIKVPTASASGVVMPVYSNGKRILLVDDDHHFQVLIRQELEGHGYEVVIAKNGRDGLSKLEESHIDLVIVDYRMPLMDGSEFVRAVRSNPHTQQVPIFLLSVFGDTLNAADLGVELCLRKPMQLRELRAEMARVLFSAYRSRAKEASDSKSEIV